MDRLFELREKLINSDFFFSHEVVCLQRLNLKKESLEFNFKIFKTNKMIGSSLLFVHDERKANLWMIDFGKTRPLLNGIKLTHKDEWVDGNHEDGYLIGIQSLIDIFQDTILS